MNAALRNPYRAEHLPWFGRLYRRAYRSGSPDTPPPVRFLSRMVFYAYRSCAPAPIWGRMSVDFGDHRREARFDARNHMFSAIYFHKYRRGLEPAVMGAIDRLVPQDGVFYDVGSNWGYHSIALASRPGFRGRIHAFEPWPDTFRDLADLIAELELEETIECHPFAVGAAAGEATITCGAHSGLAHLTQSSRGVPVPVRALDELQLAPPDVIKVDTEGHEEQVFCGAERLLREHRPALIFEHRYNRQSPRDRLRGVLELLESLDYALFAPAWRFAEDPQDAASAFDYPPRAGHGLQLYPCQSRTRFRYPKFPDLLACHRDRLSLLDSRRQAHHRRAVA